MESKDYSLHAVTLGKLNTTAYFIERTDDKYRLRH